MGRAGVSRVVRITIGDWTKNKRAYRRSPPCDSLPPHPPPSPRESCPFSLTLFVSVLCASRLLPRALCPTTSALLLLNSQYVCRRRRGCRKTTPYNIISRQCIYRAIPETMPIVRRGTCFRAVVSSGARLVTADAGPNVSLCEINLVSSKFEKKI